MEIHLCEYSSYIEKNSRKWCFYQKILINKQFENLPELHSKENKRLNVSETGKKLLRQNSRLRHCSRATGERQVRGERTASRRPASCKRRQELAKPPTQLRESRTASRGAGVATERHALETRRWMDTEIVRGI